MARKIADVTDDAVEDATGDNWDGWLDRLDDRGGVEMDHKAIVAALDEAGVESGWWRQKIAVGYEQERGGREVGETADAGYQVGVQRTLPISRADLWALLIAHDGRRLWLGDAPAFAAEPGTAYETDDGTTGEIRTVAHGERLRLTWQPAYWDAPSTLQLTLSCPRNTDEKTVLRIHHERLADGDVREEMRERWRAVLDEIETLVDEREK